MRPRRARPDIGALPEALVAALAAASAESLSQLAPEAATAPLEHVAARLGVSLG